MPVFIKGNKLATSGYSLAPEAEAAAPGLIVSLGVFLADDNAEAVTLGPDDEVESLAPCLRRAKVIALDFPMFNDGRAYSAAAMLRRDYGYGGEVRAVGDVRADELEQMVRCGFDAFELADGQDVDLALGKLAGFGFSYQQAADRPPLFRLRSGEGLEEAASGQP